MNLNDIKIELFDKCHELVFEYMKERERNDRTWVITTEDEFHTRHGELLTQVFEDLTKGKFNR